MSIRVDLDMPMMYTRPTRSGTRRRPRSRDRELLRPSQMYRIAVRFQLARMAVIDDLRQNGFQAD